jgi:hypothetical protein
MAVLHAVLGVAPAGLVRSFTWRTLLADIGPDQQFWTALLHNILDHQLTKAHLVAVMAAIGDFTGHHRPMPGDLEWKRPVLVLQSEHDRAFASQANKIRAVYPTAAFHVVAGAGQSALFTHTDQYIDLLQAFLADPVAFVAASSQDSAINTPRLGPDPNRGPPGLGGLAVRPSGHSPATTRPRSTCSPTSRCGRTGIGVFE